MASEFDGRILGETVNSALALAATEAARVGQPLQTGRLLAALETVDGLGDWNRIWMHTKTSGIGLAEALDDAGDQFASPRGAWHGVPLSPSLSDAMQTLVILAERYSMIPVPPGLLALALVADPNAGSTRALLRSGDISHDQLLEMIQADLLRVGLEGLSEILTSDASDNQRSTLVPSKGPFNALPPLPSEVQIGWSPEADLPPLPSTLRTTLAGGHCLRRPKEGTDPCVVAVGDNVFKIYDLRLPEPDDQQRIRAQANLGQSINGLEGIVPVEVTEEWPALIVEMPRMGQSLEAYIECASVGKRPSLTAEASADTFARVADALDGLHQRGLVHGNIKPSNLLVLPATGWLSIADVGGVPSVNRVHVTRTLRRLLLDRYTAPEQHDGEFGPAVDQYALGRTTADVFRARNAPPLTTPVHEVLRRAMAPRPGDRYPSAAAFGSALREAVRIEAPRRLAERVTRWQPVTRARLEPTGLALAFAVVIAIVEARRRVTTPVMAEVLALMIVAFVPLITWMLVWIAGMLGELRPFPSLTFLNRRFVAPATLLAVVGGLFFTSTDHSNLDVNIFWLLIGVYSARAFLASPSAVAGSRLVRLLWWWDRRRLGKVPRWILSALGLAVAAGVLAAPLVITKVAPKDWPKRHVSEFAPLAVVWNFRNGLGMDDGAYICKELVALPNPPKGTSCEPLMHAAAVVQSGDPILRRAAPVAGERGTWETFLAQEIPGAAGRRTWRLLASDAPDDDIGFMYTEPSGQLQVLLYRDPAKTSASSGVSTWMYTLERRDDSWKLVGFRACEIGAAGTGLAPAKCIITDSSSSETVAKINAAARKD